MIIELHAKSDVGRVRRGNEDNFLLLDLSSGKFWTREQGDESPDDMRKIEIGKKGIVFIVSDGMGGALAGDVASRMAVESVRDMLVGSDDLDSEEESGCSDDTPLVDCLRRATGYANLAI